MGLAGLKTLRSLNTSRQLSLFKFYLIVKIVLFKVFEFGICLGIQKTYNAKFEHKSTVVTIQILYKHFAHLLENMQNALQSLSPVYLYPVVRVNRAIKPNAKNLVTQPIGWFNFVRTYCRS